MYNHMHNHMYNHILTIFIIIYIFIYLFIYIYINVCIYICITICICIVPIVYLKNMRDGPLQQILPNPRPRLKEAGSWKPLLQSLKGHADARCP